MDPDQLGSQNSGILSVSRLSIFLAKKALSGSMQLVSYREVPRLSLTRGIVLTFDPLKVLVTIHEIG